MSVSGNLLTAGLSNGVIVLWELRQELPIGYFKFFEGIDITFLQIIKIELSSNSLFAR